MVEFKPMPKNNIPSISIALATFNEEKNIAKCLTSLKDLASEIVVIDGSSSDKTVEIAKKYGAKTIVTTNKKMFHINKNLAISNCQGDWILLMDADERVSKELSDEILKTVRQKPHENGFWVNRRNWFLGGFIQKGGVYPDRVIRLFKKGKGRLPEVSVHEQVKIDGDLGYLKNNLLHFADPNFSRYLQRSDRYSTLSSLELTKNNPGLGVFTMINYMFFKPITTFANIYFRHKGYQDNFRGFVWAFFSASQHFFSYIKYWQKKHNL